MAFDKLVDSAALEANLKTVADAIREKAGTSDALAFPAGFAEAIAAISAGGVSFGNLTPSFYEVVDAESKGRVWVDHDFFADKNYVVIAFHDLRTVTSPPTLTCARATIGFYYGSLGKKCSLDIIEMTSGSYGRGNLKASSVYDGVYPYLDGLAMAVTYSYEVGVPYNVIVFEF